MRHNFRLRTSDRVGCLAVFRLTNGGVRVFLTKCAIPLALLLLFGGVVFSQAQSSSRPIVVQLIDEKTGRETSGLSNKQVDDLILFVRTLPGIDHSVQEINGTSPPDVIVHTGRNRTSGGDLLYIRRHGDHWTLVKKTKWRLIREPSRRKGDHPVVYEKEY
jgi:hypothetical protein